MTILFHPSSVGLLMGAPKSIDPAFLQDKELSAIYRKKSTKTPEEQAILAPYWERTLSEGAKSYLKQMAREHLFGYRRIITTKELEKGIVCEPDSIALYNTVHFTRYQKNTQRRFNDWLTGECDIYAPGVETIDTKSVWSLDSFPLLSEDAHDTMYDWQGVAYMMLWPDVQRHRVAFCAVDTPDDLIKWLSDDERAAHKVSHIDPSMRVTVITYERDPEKERRLMVKMDVAREYLNNLIDRFKSERT